MRPQVLLSFALLLLLTGCASTPVRHLASDAAMIKPGQSTTKDMLRYLGDPSAQRNINSTTLEYIYNADQPGRFSNVPLVNSWLGTSGYEMIIILVENDVVTSCEFHTFSTSDKEWMNDYTWKEIE